MGRLWKRSAARDGGEGCSPQGCDISPHSVGTRDKGAILSRERMAPWTPKRTRGEGPSTPNIAGLLLEGLHTLRSVGAVYMASP